MRPAWPGRPGWPDGVSWMPCGSASRSGGRLPAVPGPARTAKGRALDRGPPRHVEALLELFRITFPITVIDTGFCLEEDEELLYDQVRLRRNAVTRLAVQTADLVVVVARADPVGLHAFIRGYQEP